MKFQSFYEKKKIYLKQKSYSDKIRNMLQMSEILLKREISYKNIQKTRILINWKKIKKLEEKRRFKTS